MAPESPYLGVYRYLRNRDPSPGEKMPKMVLTVLNGGKALGSKVRFA